MLKHGSVVRPTKFMASLDVKTAFDEVRPRQIAKIMENHDIHWWLIDALLREMPGLEGKAMFECVESSFNFTRCLRQGNVEAPRLWQMMAAQLPATVEGKWKQKNLGLLLDIKGEKAHQICSFMWDDNFWIMSHSKGNLSRMLGQNRHGLVMMDQQKKEQNFIS